MRARFELGKVVATPTSLELLHGMEISDMIYKHNHGDFGDLGIEDIMLQDDALEREKQNPDAAERMLSVWMKDGRKFYIITEADRSVTTLLLAEEY